ncbi:MAG: YggS family pyridoxal phosphate-dependent enzyme [Candidatus Omnitrophica bacterium]|nr:YggS family pyridoxal phosphate-dependent enzyme [Candidatus Omnitrophota bacterium]
MSEHLIRENTESILKELPEGVMLAAAAKERTAEEINAAIEAGVRIVGQNYVQEALSVFPAVNPGVKWHFIGHLQKNKVKKAVEIFDMIETVDSLDLAREISKRCAEKGRDIEIMIEVNSGKESGKHGIFPEDAEGLVREISILPNIRIKGLMTMGPFSGDPEEARPYFQRTKKLFDIIKNKDISGADMIYLSMGMTDSYKIAVEEGANIVRIGTKIFGTRG